MNLLDCEAAIGENADGLFVARKQAITSEFLDACKSERHAKAHMRRGELNRVASVPTSVVELWTRQGRDVMNATAREIVSWLERDNLHAFITTPGRV